jgi:DNA glycosylase AlkZ-like
MRTPEILTLRLSNTGLTNSSFRSAADAVAYLGAVQAQDFHAAKWALGLRVKNATDQTIEKSFNAGKILRTHVLRPTWHFVTPENIRWMLDLTSPRIKAILRPYNRKLDLDDALFSKSNAAIVKTLKKQRYLTRQEIKTVLSNVGTQTNVQRLAHIVNWAELEALICSGPCREKQLTYALMEERVPKYEKIAREEALSKLALIYFTSHGPAQIADFAWWGGLTAGDARIAIDLIKSQLEKTTRDSKTYWFVPRQKMGASRSQSAYLLSIYDEYTIAYKDRSDLSSGREIERAISLWNAFNGVIVLNGRVAGAWKKTPKKNSTEIDLNPFREFNKREQNRLRSEIIRYRKFFGYAT